MLAAIIILILLGAFLVLVELVLFPGLSIAGICALGAYWGAVYLAFDSYGSSIGYTILIISVLTAVLAIMLAFRSKLWQRFSLKSKIEGQSQKELSHNDIAKGTKAITLTRLAPVGTIQIEDQQFEARSQGAYIDPKQEVVVVGVENFNVIVKKVE